MISAINASSLVPASGGMSPASSSRLKAASFAGSARVFASCAMSQGSIRKAPTTLESPAAALAAIIPPMLWPATAIRAGSIAKRATVAGARSHASAASASSVQCANEKRPGLPQLPDNAASARSTLRAARLGRDRGSARAGKAVEEHQRGMRSRTGGGVEQRVHCSIPRRDNQRRHGRWVCGIARWIDGYRRLDLRGRLPRRQDRCRGGQESNGPGDQHGTRDGHGFPLTGRARGLFRPCRHHICTRRIGNASLRTWAAWSGASHHGFSPRCSLLAVTIKQPLRSNVAPLIGRLLALSGHPTRPYECPLSGVKRTWLSLRKMSANDPKRTFTHDEITQYAKHAPKVD